RLVVNIFDMNNNGYNEIVVGGSGKTSIFEVEAVRLLRPNGGEVFQGNTQQLIRWQKFYPPRCDSFALFYSIDNGINYSRIAHGISGNDTSYLWTVPNVNSDSCKIKIIAYGPGWQYDESNGVFSITSTGIEEHSSLSALRLSLKVERRINPATAIFSIPSFQRVNLKLYDIQGRLIRDFVNETKEPGIYKINLNTKSLSSGIYFLSLETKMKRIIERLVVVK
ncbi:MAG: T9SS type A sorting domain-containing protein, partial [candidate division WOR-3 bacterium]